MSNRDKLLKAAEQLNIPIPKGKYIKNEDLKTLIVEFVNRKKTKSVKKKRTPVNLTNKLKNSISQPQSSPKSSRIRSHKTNKYKVDIKRSCFPKVKKLVAIGDIHGDLPAALKSLKLAGVIDMSIPNNTTDLNKIRWTGGSTVVVQLGDQIDRVRPSNLVNDLCPENDEHITQDEGSDLKIIMLFEKLHSEANKVGGALFSILGNHELMNIEGDFRYVSPKEFKEFGLFFRESPGISKANNIPFGYKTRKEVFQPGGTLSKKLAKTRYSILQIGSWVFVHGGITAQLASEYSIDDVNKYIKDWLMGHDDVHTLNHIQNIYHRDDDDNSPFWSRTFSGSQWNTNHDQHFYKTLQILNQKNNRNANNKIAGMIVGHSPQFMHNKPLNSVCNNRLWRVDVGMSRAFGLANKKTKENMNRKVQVLVINNDKDFQILKEE